MFKRIALILAVTLPLFAAEEPLTNDDVVKLSKAGLAAETIVAKIRASNTKFTTDTDSLVALAQQGVADAVIRAMVETPAAPPPTRTTTPAAPAARAKRKRIEEVSVATAAGGRCEHATLELTAAGIRTTGCHETDVNVAWKDVTHVCYLYSFRSTLVVATASGERRIHTTTPAELQAVAEAIRALAPKVAVETACR